MRLIFGKGVYVNFR